MLICPRSHTWLRLCGRGWAQVGFTARAIEDIGALRDVRAGRGALLPVSGGSNHAAEVGGLPAPGDTLPAGAPLLEIGWEGLISGGADELYHCIQTPTAGCAPPRN